MPSAFEQREARAEARALGLCTQCMTKDVFRKSARCVACRATARAANERRKRSQRQNRCGCCGELGHNSRSCA